MRIPNFSELKDLFKDKAEPVPVVIPAPDPYAVFGRLVAAVFKENLPKGLIRRPTHYPRLAVEISTPEDIYASGSRPVGGRRSHKPRQHRPVPAQKVVLDVGSEGLIEMRSYARKGRENQPFFAGTIEEVMQKLPDLLNTLKPEASTSSIPMPASGPI